MASTVVKIALQADVGGFVRNFNAAQGAVGKLGATFGGLASIGGAVGTALDSITDKVASAGKKLAAMGAGTLLSFAGMGVAAAQFEAKLKNVQSLLGEEGPKQFATNFQQVLNLTRQFPVSANDAAEGLYNITSSGFAGADAMKVLNVSVMAASAGLTTVESASTAITATLNAFGLGAEKAADVSDVLFSTVNLGVLRFEDLTGVLGDSAGSAAAAGLSYAELGSAIATMTLSGISAAESGTAMNQLTKSLIDPSEELSTAFRAMGFESGQAALAQLGLHGTMEKLRVATNGNLASLLAYFPEIRAARGALALMSAEGENYNRVAGEIENKTARAGATQRAFNAQAEGTAMSFKMLVNSVHAAAIELGTAFLPAANAIIKIITSIVNAFGDLPGPLKTLISWFGALSGTILSLGGIFLAFQAKSFLINQALNLIGRSATNMGTQLGSAGARFTTFGNSIKASEGSFRLTRLAIQGLNVGIGAVGNVVAGAGERVTVFSSRLGPASSGVAAVGNAMQLARGATSGFSNALGFVGKALGGLLSFAGPIAALGFAAFSAFTQGKQAAQEFADTITKDLKPEKPASLAKNYQQLTHEISNMKETMQAATGSVGGFFSQFGKDVTDALTNIVGIDVIDDSSWDNLMKLDALKASQRKVLEQMNNLRENATEIFNQLHPDKQLPPGEFLGINSEDIAYIAIAAEEMGIKLTGAFDHSSASRQRAITHIAEMTRWMNAMGHETTVVSETMISRFAKMEEAEKKAAQGAADAFTKSFDLLKAVDPTKLIPGTEALAPVGAQIEQFYTESIASATEFYSNIEQLQQRHLDPSVIMKFLQAGPEAAGTVVKAAVEDSTGGLIEILNKGETELAKFAERAAEFARLTARAMSSPTDELSKLLPQATAIANELFSEGKLATPETVAKALGMSEGQVREIATKFGITLAESVKFEDIIPAMGPLQGHIEAVRDDLEGLFDSLINFTQLNPQAAANIVSELAKALAMPGMTETDLAARKTALDKLKSTIRDIPNLGEEQKGWLINMIGAEEAKIKLQELKDTLKGSPFAGGEAKKEQVFDFVMSVIGQEDAVAKFREFSEQEKLIPTQRIMFLRVMGTPEALAEADKIQMAINVLQGKNLPITADNVDAILKSEDVDRTLADLAKPRPPLKIDADAEPAKKKKKEVDDDVKTLKGITVIFDADGNPAKAKVTETQGKIDSLKGKEVGLKAENKEAKQGVDEAQRKIDSFHGKDVKIDVNSNAATVASAAQAAMRGVENVTRTITIVTKEVKEAEGGIIPPQHAAGGLLHRPGVYPARHPGILFAEPDTGGESYIPWATSKRPNAERVLRTTASAFGYDLMQKGMNRAMGIVNTMVTKPRTVSVNTVINMPPGPWSNREQIKSTVESIVDNRDRKLANSLFRKRE